MGFNVIKTPDTWKAQYGIYKPLESELKQSKFRKIDPHHHLPHPLKHNGAKAGNYSS